MALGSAQVRAQCAPTYLSSSGNVQGNNGAGGIAAGNGILYTAVQTGLRIIDFTDPTTPTPLGTISNVGILGQHISSIAVDGDYAFVVSFESTPMTIIDVSDPANPAIVGSIAVAGHSVEAAGAYAYVATGPGGGLQAFDVSNPAALDCSRLFMIHSRSRRCFAQ
jgi:hypothetical protein